MTTKPIDEHPFIREAHTFIPVDLADREVFMQRLEQVLHQQFLAGVEAVERGIEKQIGIHKVLAEQWTGILIEGSDISKSRINPHEERIEELTTILTHIATLKSTNPTN